LSDNDYVKQKLLLQNLWVTIDKTVDGFERQARRLIGSDAKKIARLHSGLLPA